DRLLPGGVPARLDDIHSITLLLSVTAQSGAGSARASEERFRKVVQPGRRFRNRKSLEGPGVFFDSPCLRRVLRQQAASPVLSGRKLLHLLCESLPFRGCSAFRD